MLKNEPNPAASGRGIRVGLLSKEVGSADNNYPNAFHPRGNPPVGGAEDSGGYNKVLLFGFFAGTIALDQLIKLIITHYFSNLVLYNSGVAFSLFQNANIFILYLIFLAFLIYFLPQINLATVFLISAATSNFLDRVFYGGVVDYINLKIWPTFNLADIIIVVSVCFLIISLIRQNIKTVK